MRVFKFGGASVKDEQAVRNTAKIIESFPNGDLLIVVSAMGKTTNALESLVHVYREGQADMAAQLEAVVSFHRGICKALQLGDSFFKEVFDPAIFELSNRLQRPPSDNYDYDYDQIVSYGEVLSSLIISSFLNKAGIPSVWADARRLIRTDNNYREGRINWKKTEELVQAKWSKIKEESADAHRAIMLTQGFIGHTDELNTTTLGREGSDFSAAIFAYVLNAENVTIWKDVPGMLNADPKYFKDAVKLKRISYREAIELSYYGASVIHPKTIKPLQNKNIILYVKSFIEPKSEGTIIDASTFSDSLIPSYIFKSDQILISFTPRDFSFITEENLGQLFGIFVKEGVKVNLMQNSAINFSICVDYHKNRLEAILEEAKKYYEVLYNYPCQLVTIRHYDQETISRLLIGKKVLVEQRSRSTARMVLTE